MSSRIEQLIDEMEEYIEGCKFAPFSSEKILVNKGEIEDLLQELRMKTPDEIKRYQKIISNKEAIINDARIKAQQLIEDATEQTNELISEHEIMQQAYAQANEVVTMATQQAQDIRDRATMEANGVRASAVTYIDEQLAKIESIISAAIDEATSHYQALTGELNECLEVIRSNRAELYQPEGEEEEE